MNLNILARSSLKSRVTFFTLVVFVLSIWSLAFYVSHMLRADMQRVVSEQLFSNVEVLAKEINDELTDKVKALELVASAIDASLISRPEALQKMLEDRLILRLAFNAGTVVTNATGIAISSISASDGRNGSNFLAGDQIASTLKNGKPHFSLVFNSDESLAPVVFLAVPVLNSHQSVIGSLVGSIDLNKANFLEVVTQNHYGKTGGFLLIAPEYRRFVTATDKSILRRAFPAPGLNPLLERYLLGFEGIGSVVDTTGLEVLSAAKRVPIADWVMVARIPTAEAFAPIQEMQKRMLTVTIFLTLLAGGLTYLMLRWQLSPLTAAVQALPQITNDNFSKKPLAITHQDEIGELIGGFNGLLETLGQREEVLKNSERLLKESQSIAGLGSYVLDFNTGIWKSSEVLDNLFGIDASYVRSVEGWEALIHADDRSMMATYFREHVLGQMQRFDKIYRFLRQSDRAVRWAHGLGKLEFDDRGYPSQMHGTIQDITDRTQSELKLQLAANVFTHAREGITITDTDGIIIDVNDAFTRITGYSRDEAIGQNPRLLKSGHQDASFYAAMWSDLLSVGYWKGEIWNRRKNGELFAEMIAISVVRDAEGRALQYVALFSDITTLKEHQHQLEHIAHYDALTNLPNRVLLADRLQQAIVQAHRRNNQLAVAYLDLDGFKSINDQHGHKVGDQVLIAVAARMRQALREGDTLSRLGGDEFVAVLSDLDDVAASLPLLTRLLAAAAQVVQFEGLELHVTASIGVTFYPQVDEIDADQLMRQADQAMYQAKLAGKNRYQIFDATHDIHLREFHESLERIRFALDSNEFVLHYQPKVNMRTGQVVGAEALIRWQHPSRGLLEPSKFLPVIENHPLAIAVGEWVIETALTQMDRWDAEGLQLPVSVNIGARQLQQANFVDRLRSLLADHPNMRYGNLTLEVLETSALEDIALVSQVIESCNQIGVQFALDDFGTGYSSLTYLKRLRVSMLKIDQSFVRDMLEDPDDLAILQGVIGLAAAFKRDVIAEGVETVEHGTLLLQLGCELAQGYGIARPMPATEMPNWAANWIPDSAWTEAPWLWRAPGSGFAAL